MDPSNDKKGSQSDTGTQRPSENVDLDQSFMRAQDEIRSAFSRLQYGRAEAIQDALIRLVDARTEAGDPRRIDVQKMGSLVFASLGDTRRADEALDRAIELIGEGGSSEVEAIPTQFMKANLYVETGQSELATKLLGELLSLVDNGTNYDLDPTDEVKFFGLLARAALLGNKRDYGLFEDSLRELTTTIERLSFGNPDSNELSSVADELCTTVRGMLRDGSFKEAGQVAVLAMGCTQNVEACRESFETARALASDAMLAVGDINAAVNLRALNLDSASVRLNDGHPLVQSRRRGFAAVLTEKGCFLEAERLLKEGVEDGYKTNDSSEIRRSVRALSAFYRECGSHQKAYEQLASLDMSDAVDAVEIARDADGLAILLAELGRSEEAKELLDSTLERLQEAGEPKIALTELSLLITKASILQYEDREAALVVIAEAEEVLLGVPSVLSEGARRAVTRLQRSLHGLWSTTRERCRLLEGQLDRFTRTYGASNISERTHLTIELAEELVKDNCRQAAEEHLNIVKDLLEARGRSSTALYATLLTSLSDILPAGDHRAHQFRATAEAIFERLKSESSSFPHDFDAD